MGQIKPKKIQTNGRYRARARDDRSHAPLSMDAHYVWHAKNQTGTCPKSDSSTLFMYDDHVMVITTLSRRETKENSN